MSEPAAEVVDLEPETGELVPYEPAPATLYGTRDPRIALERMGELANALMDVVRTKQLAVNIRNREHLTVEAWTTLGALVGVHAAIVWTKPNESGDGILARAEARTLAGALVGAAEAECSRVESRWKTAEPYAVRSMASTRAISRALQAPLRHIAVLAGYEGAGAEEMPADVPGPVEPAAPVQPTLEQKGEIKTLLRSLDLADPAIDWPARAREIAKVPWEMLTRSQAAYLIEQLRGELAALMPGDDEKRAAA
jgi:hypothetical protein